MNVMEIRGRWNRFRGSLLLCWSRMTGNRRGRVSGRLLRLFGEAQVGLGRCRQGFDRMVSGRG